MANLAEFWDGQKNITLMDPNILVCPDRWDLLNQLAASGAYVDFNQGLDIRLMDNDVTDLLSSMRVKCLHFAWDNPHEDLERDFQRFAERYSRKDRRVKVVYVLTNYNSTAEEDLHRIYTLRALGYDPYVMIYDKEHAPRETRLLQRWCNNRIIFNTVPDFRAYDCKMG